MPGLMRAGSVVAGTATPLVLQSTVDQPGRSLTRPSVLAGVGGGGVLLGMWYAVRNNMIAPPVGSRSDFQQTAYLAGLGLLTTGTVSALTGTASNNNLSLPAV